LCWWGIVNADCVASWYHLPLPAGGCRRAEEEAAKAAAAEAKKAREAEKKLLKKERQRLRGLAVDGEQRLISEGGQASRYVMLNNTDVC
jgi:hypothetical protein